MCWPCENFMAYSRRILTKYTELRLYTNVVEIPIRQMAENISDSCSGISTIASLDGLETT